MKLYLARDMDGELRSFPTQPYWVKLRDYWAASGDSADPCQRLPRDWFPEIEPGQCVELETAKPAVVLDGAIQLKLDTATELLKRCYLCGHREGWQDSETTTECFEAVNNFMSANLGFDWIVRMDHDREVAQARKGAAQ